MICPECGKIGILPDRHETVNPQIPNRARRIVRNHYQCHQCQRQWYGEPHEVNDETPRK